MPGFHFSRESGCAAEIHESLRGGRTDVGLASLTGTPPPGIECHPLLRMPLVILADASSDVRDSARLLDRDRIELPLITLPRHEPAPGSIRPCLPHFPHHRVERFGRNPNPGKNQGRRIPCSDALGPFGGAIVLSLTRKTLPEIGRISITRSCKTFKVSQPPLYQSRSSRGPRGSPSRWNPA